MKESRNEAEKVVGLYKEAMKDLSKGKLSHQSSFL